MYNYDLLNMGVDPDDLYDPPTRHCPGPAIEQSHGCGRWVARAGDMCKRCDAESTQWHAEQIAERRRDQAYLEQRIAELDKHAPDDNFSTFSDADMPTEAEQRAYVAQMWSRNTPTWQIPDANPDEDLPF